METYSANGAPLAEDTPAATRALPQGGGVAILTGAFLSSIKYRNGYTQTLAHDAGSRPTSVTDSYGRTLSFNYSGSLLQSLTTPDNTTISYGYGTVALPVAAESKIRSIPAC